MRPTAKLTIAAGLTGVLALGAFAAMAQADRGWGPGRGHGQAMFDMMAERYDADKDGKISQQEIDANRTERHGRYDADKDGGLTLQEFQGLWLEAQRQRMVREFQDFDRDGDGKVVLDEYMKPLAGMVARRDRDKDGAWSLEDVRRHGKPGMGGPGGAKAPATNQ